MDNLEEIKAALRLTLELETRATLGPWEHKSEDAESVYHIGPHSGISDMLVMLMWPTHPPEETAEIEQVWFDTAAFIAHARTFTPLAAQSLLSEIESHEKYAKGYDNLSVTKYCRLRLEIICHDWQSAPKISK